jgi:outer membrane protein
MREGISNALRGALVAAVAATALTAAPTVAQQAATKVAVIDVRRLVTESVAGKEALGRLKKLQDDKIAEAKTKQDEIEALRKKLSDGQLSLSEDKLTELQKQLDDKTTAFRRFQEDAQKDFEKTQEQTFSDIERRVGPVIEQAGKEGGYTLVFNKYQSGLVYADETVDITADIIRRFDAATSASAAPKSN